MVIWTIFMRYHALNIMYSTAVYSTATHTYSNTSLTALSYCARVLSTLHFTWHLHILPSAVDLRDSTVLHRVNN